VKFLLGLHQYCFRHGAKQQIYRNRNTN